MGIFGSRKGGVMKPIRNLEVSAGGVGVEVRRTGMDMERECVGEVGDISPFAERNG